MGDDHESSSAPPAMARGRPGPPARPGRRGVNGLDSRTAGVSFPKLTAAPGTEFQGYTAQSRGVSNRTRSLSRWQSRGYG